MVFHVYYRFLKGRKAFSFLNQEPFENREILMLV